MASANAFPSCVTYSSTARASEGNAELAAAAGVTEPLGLPGGDAAAGPRCDVGDEGPPPLLLVADRSVIRSFVAKNGQEMIGWVRVLVLLEPKYKIVKGR